MKHTMILILAGAALIYVMPGKAAADDYGERFYDHTPAGMAEYTAPSLEVPDVAMDDMAEDLQDIMPAAGDEEADGTPAQAGEEATTADESAEIPAEEPKEPAAQPATE